MEPSAGSAAGSAASIVHSVLNEFRVRIAITPNADIEVLIEGLVLSRFGRPDTMQHTMHHHTEALAACCDVMDEVWPTVVSTTRAAYKMHTARCNMGAAGGDDGVDKEALTASGCDTDELAANGCDEDELMASGCAAQLMRMSAALVLALALTQYCTQDAQLGTYASNILAGIVIRKLIVALKRARPDTAKRCTGATRWSRFKSEFYTARSARRVLRHASQFFDIMAIDVRQ